MALAPLTRASKGSALIFTEMDNNLTLLAQDATKTQQGNVEIATQAESDSLTSEVLAVSPSTLTQTVDNIRGTRVLDTLDLYTNGSGGTGTIAITSIAPYDIVEVETKDGSEYFIHNIFVDSITFNRRYLITPAFTSSGGSTMSKFEFDSNTSMTLTNSFPIDGITRVTGMRIL